jgi:D-sedoheptulose 7-phosphate isomerase
MDKGCLLMDEFEFISEHFAATAELIDESAGELVSPIVAAAGSIAESILGDGKVLCCGHGGGAVAAQWFTTLLQHKLHDDRPALPAMSIGLDSVTQNYLISDGHAQDMFAKPIQSLGHDNDILLVVAPEGSHPAILQAIQAAHSRGLIVICLCAGEASTLTNMLDKEDIAIELNCNDHSQALEIQMMTIHALCQLIEWYIFSSEDFSGE